MVKYFINWVMNWFRSENQVRRVRGRWCSIKRIRTTVYRVSVIDENGRFVGSRFITPTFTLNKEIDEAVYSLLMTGVTY